MAKVMVIPADPHREKVRSRIEDTPKLRVAAYCRVSTDTDEQATSYETQVEHYTEYISNNPKWTLAGIYADDGISGTNTKNRAEFNKMIDACMAGKIDMVITKSISRFARNTLDCLKYIRQLKERNIPVFFEKESINTLDAKGEVLITIMASLAQQESQSLSQNVKLGLQYRYQQGKVQVNHNHFLGYTKDADGNLIIDPVQAETVKRIYREYLEGFSMDKIKAGLERDGILTGAGKTRWYTSTINKILRNEKYIGDALLQKTYTTDFLSKTRVKNNGIMPQYYVEGDHEAIIPKDIYLRVQNELARRRRVTTTSSGRKCAFSGHHVFSQMVFCGECGEMFRRVHWNNRGVKSIVWRCLSRLKPTGLECHARTVNEEALKAACLSAFNKLLDKQEGFQKRLEENVRAVMTDDGSSGAMSVSAIDDELAKLQKQLIQCVETRKDYKEIADRILKLRDMRRKNNFDDSAREEYVTRINDVLDFIRKQSSELTVFDEALTRCWIKRITVSADKYTIEFKSGISVDIQS